MTNNLPIHILNYEYGSCPNCDHSWDEGLIWENWKQIRDLRIANNEPLEWFDKTDEELQKEATSNYSEPHKFSGLVGIEIPTYYDGISVWQCDHCKSMWSRWTGEYLGTDLNASAIMKLQKEGKIHPIVVTKK